MGTIVTEDINDQAQGDAGDNVVTSYTRGASTPWDSDLFSTSEYLRALSGSNIPWYRLYVRHLEYFTGMYRLKGDDDVKRLSKHILRQAVEFGKVGLIMYKGKLLPIAIVNLEYDKFKNIVMVEGTTLRNGTGYTKNINKFKLKINEVVVLQNNYQSFPFIFFWDDIIRNIIRLEASAITGSIASIKKFKRNLANNDSSISKIETESMLNPYSPYVNNIIQPSTYRTEAQMRDSGDMSGSEKVSSLVPNSIEVNSINDNTDMLWNNLKEYINHVYYQNGRRINTNKKNERNLEGEINTEVINFTFMEREFRNYLEQFKDEVVAKFGINIEIEFVIDEMEVRKGVDAPGSNQPNTGKGEM